MESNSTNPQQDGENYSVDEMMARLKRNERSKRPSDSDKEGELVTREDGSQVVKVRRRKRRSKQPEKKQKKTNPKLKWAILGSIIGLLVVLAAGTIFIIAKYNGRKFKESTETTISGLSGAQETTLTQLRVTPVSAKATKVDLSWDQHSFFHTASFQNLKADIKATSFFSSDWIGEEVVSSQGELYLQTPANNTESSVEPVLSPYHFGVIRCDKLDLRFGQDRSAPAITGIQIAMGKAGSGKRMITFHNGLMKIKNWPALVISSGVITLNPQDAQIEALLEAGDSQKGELTIKGRIDKDTSQPIVLDVKAKDYPIQELLGKGLGRILQGEIRSDMGALTYDYKKPTGEALSFIMPFNATELRMSELPMFTDLKTLVGDTQYVRPIFNDCRGTIMRTSEGVTLNDLNLTSSRVITIRGHLQVAPNGSLTGELDVGIPHRLFSKSAPAPSIFSEPHNGFIHTKVTLGGSIHNPHDNLNERLQASKSTRSPVLPPAARKDEAIEKEKEFNDLTR